MNKPASVSNRARVKARRSAVQALYQWNITSSSLSEILKEFMSERKELNKADKDYFVQLLDGVGKHRDELEDLMRDSLDRSVEELDPVERAILWLSVYELQHQPEVPLRVVINESIELAKMFGAEESHKYINGIVDKIGQTIRKHESKKANAG